MMTEAKIVSCWDLVLMLVENLCLGNRLLNINVSTHDIDVAGEGMEKIAFPIFCNRLRNESISRSYDHKTLIPKRSFQAILGHRWISDGDEEMSGNKNSKSRSQKMSLS